MPLEISVFFKNVFPVDILKGNYFSLLRYLLRNRLIIKQITKVIFRYLFVTNCQSSLQTKDIVYAA